MGAVCAAGQALPEILRSFAAGERHCHAPTRIKSPARGPVFEVDQDFPPGSDRTQELARLALQEALAEARWADVPAGCRVGVCMGTTVACQLNDFDFYTTYRDSKQASLEPAKRYLENSLADVVGRWIGRPGPRLTLTNACSSSADAIGVAREWIRSGICDVALAGGADELNRVPYCGFQALGVMSAAPVIPFDRDRSGLNLGEGAAIVVLESEGHARQRGLLPGLSVRGYGAACDAHHITAPHPEGRGLERAIGAALAEAGVAASDIDFVNAHGTGTKENDRIEGRLLARLFGPAVRFLSTKGFTGHTLGAAGALEAVFTAAALREGWLPGSAGFSQSDPEIGVSPIIARTPVQAASALSTSLAFGGMNAALIITRTLTA